jgi:hypothetical protein
MILYQSAFQEPIHNQKDDSSSDRYQEAVEIETRYGSETKLGSEEPPEKGSCDPKTYRDNDASRILAGHNKFCDNPDDESHDNP